MREFMEFCLAVLKELVGVLFGLSLGSYKYGDFLVALFVVVIFVSSLVIGFKRKHV